MNVWPLSQAGWVVRSRAGEEASDVSPYDIRPLSQCLVRACCSLGPGFPLPGSFARKAKRYLTHGQLCLGDCGFRNGSWLISLSLEERGETTEGILCFSLRFPTPAAVDTSSALAGPEVVPHTLTCLSFPHRHLHNNHIQHVGTHSFEGLHNLETL